MAKGFFVVLGRAARPHLRTIATTAMLFLAAFAVVRQGLGLDWRSVSSRLAAANLEVLALALLVFYGTLPVRTLRWQLLLEGAFGAGTVWIAPARELLTIMFRSWFVNSVTVARLGDVYRADLLNRATGASRPTTLGSIVAERVIDLAALVATLGAAALLAFRGQVPREFGVSAAAGLTLTVGAFVVAAAVNRWRTLVMRLMPGRFHAQIVQLSRGFTASLARLPLIVGLSITAWLLEGTTLFLIAAAVGAPLSFAGTIAAALIGSLLTTIPLSPAGLGFTEVGMVVILHRIGVDAGSAGAIALLYRLVTFWSLVVCGGVFLLTRRSAVAASRAAG